MCDIEFWRGAAALPLDDVAPAAPVRSSALSMPCRAERHCPAIVCPLDHAGGRRVIAGRSAGEGAAQPD